jgi:hypothetical protein
MTCFAESAVRFYLPIEGDVAFRANKLLLLKITAAIDPHSTPDNPHSLTAMPANGIASPSNHFTLLFNRNLGSYHGEL